MYTILRLYGRTTVRRKDPLLSANNGAGKLGTLQINEIVNQLMRTNNLSSQSGTFRRRLNDDQGRGEPTKKKPPRFLTRPIKSVLLLGIWAWLVTLPYSPEKLGRDNLGQGRFGARNKGLYHVGQVLCTEYWVAKDGVE